MNTDIISVKIKQEKLSPPRKTENDLDKVISEILPISNLFGPVLNSDSEKANDDEKKIPLEPIKSSNEILAELFKVFNAAPPESLMNDDYLLKKQKKHKHKDKKHKKKSKKKEKSSSPSQCSDDCDKLKKHKKKKRKSSRKSKESSSRKTINETTDDIQKEITNSPKPSYESDITLSDEETEITHNEPEPPLRCIKKEKVNSIENHGQRTKIIIKNLKNTQIFNHIDENNEKAQKEKTERAESSDISLSDEEDYLREKEYYSKEKHSYEKRDPYRRSSRSSSKHDKIPKRNFRKSWRSRSRSRHRRTRSRSRSRDLMIDKKMLLEIARKNAITMFKSGSLPGTQGMSQEVQDKVVMKMRYGGKTVEELTEFCKKLSNGESMNDFSSLSSNDDSDHDKYGNEKVFYHPFVLKDRGPIVMNIKNATPITPKTAEQTKAILMQYPVSSGQMHRLNENEWIPVSPKKSDVQSLQPLKQTQPAKNVFEKPLPSEQQKPAFTPLSATVGDDPSDVSTSPPPATVKDGVPTDTAANTPPLPATTVVETPSSQTPQTTTQSESIFSHTNMDVSSIISQRLNAMRKLQENPTDPEALKMMYKSQRDMSIWANSNFTPGQFTGSTGAKILTAQELTAGMQAWAKRDQLVTAEPVAGGMGMRLLQKMGWRPGEGLGKERNGPLQPLSLEVKLDKRGLVANEEDPAQIALRLRKKRLASRLAKEQEIINSKHPVSLLGELAAKRKWGAPAYELVSETGPAHHKSFIFKVIVNGAMYQPTIPCINKKKAKALAAEYCLQQIGILRS